MGLLLGQAIYDILKTNITVHSYVQDKIFPIFAPDSTLNPFIVYTRKSTDVFYTKDGHTYDDCQLSVYIISSNYTECVNIAESVRTSLERKTGTYQGVNLISVEVGSIEEDFNVDGYVTTINFAIKCK